MTNTKIIPWISLVALAGVGYFIYTKKSNPKKINTIIGNNNAGYSSMMKLSPKYYNTTSMEGSSDYTANYNSDTGIPTPWVLGVNGGNGSAVNAGWTAFPDTYAARVGNNWKQSEAQEARL